MEIAEAEVPEQETPQAPTDETAAETSEQETAAPEPPVLQRQETAAEEPPTEEVAEAETPAPKARPKGRPKGSVNKKPKVVTRASTPEPATPRVETTPDIFEIIRQRQMAQFERRQAFYESFLPIR